MTTIKIKKADFQKALKLECIDLLQSKYELPGMHGGLDHIEFSESKIEVFDRGMTYGQTVLDNSYNLIY